MEEEKLTERELLDELESLRLNNLYDDVQVLLYNAFPLYAIVYHEVFKKFRIVIPYENDGLQSTDDEFVYKLALQDETGFVRTVMWNLDDSIDYSEFVGKGRRPLLHVVKQCNNFLEAVNALSEIKKDGEELLKEI